MPTSENEKEAPLLWDYVPIAEYKPPAPPVTQSVRERLTFFRRLFGRGEKEQEPPLEGAENIQALPDWQLECIVPTPEWHDPAEALDVELKDWLVQETPVSPVVVMVGPPHNGHCETLMTWAQRQQWPLLSPPTAAQILAGEDTWLTKQIIENTPWVLPCLERTYLRHPEGLTVVRRFLANAYAGNLGRGIIGCDSWAWAFLRHVWRGRVPVTVTLQAFDETRLARHFRDLADASGDRPLRFLQSDDGRDVLLPPEAGKASGETSNFLQLLAAHSRGICGVARAIWRANLQSKPDEKLTDKADDPVCRIANQTVWVTPWLQMAHPGLPSGAGRDEAFVLHTLLLHNGLPLELMQRLLPLSPGRIMGTLIYLEESGLVAQDETVWQVTPQGYPAVRHFLQAGDYLVDQF
ncbi:hypothetical protein [Desulfosarcina sp.]|uniref:hypothetical protein n=1 Tax=Desulfosarcina sp. TaxID=2027861 RepID=UPI003567F233